MSEWYYAKDGQQLGPVPTEDLRQLIASGQLDPATSLVWRDGMSDWVSATEVPELSPAAPAHPPASSPATATTGSSGAPNPYAAPSSNWHEPVPPGTAGELTEIPPGSQPIDVGQCISRGFSLTNRNLGIILLTGIVYVAIMTGVGVVQGGIEVMLGVETTTTEFEFESGNGGAFTTYPDTTSASPGAIALISLLQIASNILSLFLSLGVTRIGLNLIDGKSASVGMLFGEGSKLLRAIGASILFALMVGFGLLLLIVPGIYLALRFGQYLTAIVDRDLGVIDSLAYSSSITTNNRWQLLGLGILSFLILLAGLIALIVGLIYAYPIVWLAGLVAYRWMQYGPATAQDRIA